MLTETLQEKATDLCRVCRSLGEKGWCRATSGNFSVRIDGGNCLITRSGREKSRLSPDDLMVCDFWGRAADADAVPSAETPLHTLLYRLDDNIGAVLHTHSVSATLMSMHGGDEISMRGFEMQKALAGIQSHEDALALPVFANTQDMHELATRIESAWPANGSGAPGFLIAGHGLYAWGRNLDEAERHIEGFEFLLACRWQERLAGLS